MASAQENFRTKIETSRAGVVTYVHCVGIFTGAGVWDFSRLTRVATSLTLTHIAKDILRTQEHAKMGQTEVQSKISLSIRCTYFASICSHCLYRLMCCHNFDSVGNKLNSSQIKRIREANNNECAEHICVSKPHKILVPGEIGNKE